MAGTLRPRQGLYLSVLIRLPIPAAELVWLPLMGGLAAHSAIQEVTALNVDLRWPNDILIGPRKVAGILVEAQSDSGKEAQSTAVLGIGVNLHQTSFPEGLATPATSLDLEMGGTVSRQEILVAFLQELHRELTVFSPNPESHALLSALPKRVAAISTWINGRVVEVHGPQACTGTTAGLNSQGFLVMQTESGVKTITTGGLRAPAALG